LIEDGNVLVDQDEIEVWSEQHPQPYQRDSYQGVFQDHAGTADEPHVKFIRKLAGEGLSKTGHHGPAAAMGVSRNQLPKWDDIQFVVAQLHKLPMLDEEPVGTDVVIGPNAKKPLVLDIPLFVSDMSFGALSEEARVALSKGAELAGTGICSGEGGMLPEEQAANSRYFYELASARFGFSWDKVQKTQAFHFKGGQGAKTGTGAAPLIFRDNISVPTIPALARARRHLDSCDADGVTLVITGGPRHPADFAKAMALGADAVAVSNAAIQAIGCIGMRACNTNNCPVGIATQKQHLRDRLPVELAAERLARFFHASTDLMAVLARASGHDHLSKFSRDDLTTFKSDMARLTGVAYGGVN